MNTEVPKAKRRYELQLITWALDRALRLAEVNKAVNTTIDKLFEDADTFCGKIHDIVEENNPPELDEAEKEMLREHAKHVAPANNEGETIQ